VRVPTVNQARLLGVLGNPAVMAVSGISGRRRLWTSLLNHGWVVADSTTSKGDPNGISITPDGLRALAAPVEKHGKWWT
jgi:hypothetical protein